MEQHDLLDFDFESDTLEEPEFNLVDDFDFEDEDNALTDESQISEENTKYDLDIISDTNSNLMQSFKDKQYVTEYINKENYRRYLQIGYKKENETLAIIKEKIRYEIKSRSNVAIGKDGLLFINKEINRIPFINSMDITIRLHSELTEKFSQLSDESVEEREQYILSLKNGLFKELSEEYIRTISEDGKQGGILTEKVRNIILEVTEKICNNVDSLYIKSTKRRESTDNALKKELEEIQQHLDGIENHKDSKNYSAILSKGIIITKNYVVIICGYCKRPIIKPLAGFITALIIFTEELENSSISSYTLPIYCDCTKIGIKLLLEDSQKEQKKYPLVHIKDTRRDTASNVRNIMVDEVITEIQNIIKKEIMNHLKEQQIKTQGINNLAVYKVSKETIRLVFSKVLIQLNQQQNKINDYIVVLTDDESLYIEQQLMDYMKVQIKEETEGEKEKEEREKAIRTNITNIAVKDISLAIREYKVLLEALSQKERINIQAKNNSNDNNSDNQTENDNNGNNSGNDIPILGHNINGDITVETVAKLLCEMANKSYNVELNRQIAVIAGYVEPFSNLINITERQLMLDTLLQAVKDKKKIKEKYKAMKKRFDEMRHIREMLFSCEEIYSLKNVHESLDYSLTFSDKDIEEILPLAQLLVIRDMLFIILSQDNGIIKNSFMENLGAIKKIKDSEYRQRIFRTTRNFYALEDESPIIGIRNKIANYDIHSLLLDLSDYVDTEAIKQYSDNNSYCLASLKYNIDNLNVNEKYIFSLTDEWREGKSREDYLASCKRIDKSNNLIFEDFILKVSESAEVNLVNIILGRYIKECTAKNTGDKEIEKVLRYPSELIPYRISLWKQILKKQEGARIVSSSNGARFLIELFHMLEIEQSDYVEIFDKYRALQEPMEVNILERFQEELLFIIRTNLENIGLPEEFYEDLNIYIPTNDQELLALFAEGVHEFNELSFNRRIKDTSFLHSDIV